VKGHGPVYKLPSSPSSVLPPGNAMCCSDGRQSMVGGPGGIHIRSADDHDAGNPSDLRSDLRSDKCSKTAGT